MRQQNKIALHIVKPLAKYKRMSNLLKILLWLWFIVNASICISKENICIYSMVLFFALVIINVALPFLRQSFVNTGLIVMDKERITINEKTHNIVDISSLCFNFTGCKGDIYSGAVLGIGSLGLKQGASNMLSFIDSSGNQYFYNIFLKHKYEVVMVKKMFLFYGNKIKSVEFIEK